jgi:ABC-type branched-subunit amino acid transport system permease subunit
MLVYLGTDLLAAWGLNLEFGVAGVVNFAYIVLVAAGAYFYAVFTLGPPATMGGSSSTSSARGCRSRWRSRSPP